ncbi:MAG: cupin domain-containing protein [Planctomycetaceae bacterium]|nr:cupin domain-containing protein [Planctomycetaceae bacterium]
MQYISSAASPFVPASHEDPRNPGVLKRVIATATQLQYGQVQMLNWASLPAGRSFQPHYHEDMQEVFVLLTGQVQMTVNGQCVEMNAGDTVIVEPREVHVMTNSGDAPAEYLVFGISSGQGGRTINIDA